MASKSTKSTKSTKSAHNLHTPEQQKAWFDKFTGNIMKEMQVATDKIIELYGKDHTKKTLLEKFQSRVINDYPKKFLKVDITNLPKLQKELLNMEKLILKDAGKQDKLVRGVAAKSSKVSYKSSTASKMSKGSTSTDPKDCDSIECIMDNVISQIEVQFSHYLVALKTGEFPSGGLGWWGSIKKFWGFAHCNDQ